MIDPSSPITQAAFGELIGIGQSEVSDYVRAGTLSRDATLATWLLEYCAHIRGIAAGRGGDAGPELTAERARLARAQAERIEMQNSVTRGELAPAHVLEEILGKTTAKIAKILDTIPGMLRRRYPQFTSQDVAEIAAIVAQARNMAAGLRLSDVEDIDDVDVPDQLTDNPERVA